MRVHTAHVKSFSESPFIPAVDTPNAENTEQLDREIDRVHHAARTFAKLSLDERIALVTSMQQGYLSVSGRSVIVACKAKGIIPGTPQEGEEWASGPTSVVRHMRLIREQLASIRKSGTTSIGAVRKRSSGNLSVRVFPSSLLDSLLLRNITVDVHMQPHVTTDDLAEARAGFYKKPAHEGRTVLVLGAGNFACIPVMDVLSKMFNEGKVCVLKMNPVNAYLGPFIEKAFREAIDRGFLAVVYGGVPEGDYLVRHPGIDEIHITGSDKTYEAIVWGPEGPEREKRISENTPRMNKPISAELGNVSPVIIAPGPYGSKELSYMAEDVAGYCTMNSSFVCCAAKILVLPKGWSKRDEFLAALCGILKTITPRKSYYPGAVDRFNAFVNGRGSIIRIGNAGDGTLPWGIASGLDADNSSEPLFTTESFCPVLGETAVGCTDAVEFLDQAVDFVNNRLWGTLTATLVVHPEIMRDRNCAIAVERAIDKLKYGTVSVNAFPGMSFAFASPPWGAYPGSTSLDIQSGQGWVNNTAMLEGIEKTVARFPFMSFPKPVYFPTHKTVLTLMRRMTALEEKHGWLNVPGVISAAIRG
jgi:acyl-CoA reductase-like NAD-dependent aldehyde dehydrogenase